MQSLILIRRRGWSGRIASLPLFWVSFFLSSFLPSFCFPRLAYAKVQTKVNKLKEELVRVKAEIRAEVSNAFKELKNDIHQMDSRLAQCEKGMTECRQELQTSVSVKLTDMEKKLENNTGASWSDIVAKEVST